MADKIRPAVLKMDAGSFAIKLARRIRRQVGLSDRQYEGVKRVCTEFLVEGATDENNGDEEARKQRAQEAKA